MRIIQRMKKQEFSLKEIHDYLSIRRISTMVEPESIEDIIGLLNRKKAELERRAEHLREICDLIDDDIHELLNNKIPEQKKTGVPLQALSLLSCPYCEKSLDLKRAELDSRYVYSGVLHCDCGYQIPIDGGIVKTGNLYIAPYDKPDLKRGLYRNVSEDFVTYLQRCSDFAIRELNQMALHGKVIMEGHCNGYFFLYSHLEELDEQNLYIITDKYPEMLEMYKRNIERLGLNLNILYLADATVNYPLRHGSVDLLLNFMGDNEHSLYFRRFYITDIKKFLGSNAKILGATLGYHLGSKSLTCLQKKYPEGDATGYCRELWDELYQRAGYRRQAALSGIMANSYNQYSFECHIDGEKLFMEYFLASPRAHKT